MLRVLWIINIKLLLLGDIFSPWHIVILYSVVSNLHIYFLYYFVLYLFIVHSLQWVITKALRRYLKLSVKVHAYDSNTSPTVDVYNKSKFQHSFFPFGRRVWSCESCNYYYLQIMFLKFYLKILRLKFNIMFIKELHNY